MQYGQDLLEGDNGNPSEHNPLSHYLNDVAKGEKPLDFILYVPDGYGSLEGLRVPNVIETDDPEKIFTVHFRIIW